MTQPSTNVTKQFGKFTNLLARDEVQREHQQAPPKGRKDANHRKRMDPYLSPVVQPKVNQRKPVAKYHQGEKDWENEIAKSILTIHHSEQVKANPKLAQVDKVPRGKQYTPRHIWYAGTGAVQAVWCPLVLQANDIADDLVINTATAFECHHSVCKQLRQLQQAKKYIKYINIVESMLRAECQRDGEGGQSHNPLTDLNDELKTLGMIDPSILGEKDSRVGRKRLWQQFVVCLNVFGEKLTEQGKYGAALEMLKRCEDLLNGDPLIEGRGYFNGKVKPQLKGFLYDSLSFYYFKRKKFNAGAVFSQKALKAHLHLKSWEHVAKCYLHGGTILSLMNKHEDSIRCMKQVIELLEEGQLEQGGTSAQKLCLVAVCYHNISVEQLIVSRVPEACVSSQNARRLARLCLSYSNRWLEQFEGTHEAIMETLRKQQAKKSFRARPAKKIPPLNRSGKGVKKKTRTKKKSG